VSETVRGVIIFVTAVVTIGIWAPLRNKPERLPDGVVVSETYFGVFTYLTLRTELKEPEYKMRWLPNYQRAATTALVTAGLWTAVILGTRRKGSAADRAEA
jgi:hypothetical protein